MKNVHWIEWLAAIAMAVAAGTAFLFTTFQTKTEASQNYDRMTRIEEKIDLIMLDRHIKYYNKR